MKTRTRAQLLADFRPREFELQQEWPHVPPASAAGER